MVCYDRETHRQLFINLYGDYCTVIHETGDVKTVIEVLKSQQTNIQLIFLGEEIVQKVNNQPEQYRSLFRDLIVELRERYPKALIHIHFRKESIEAYSDLMELGNVYDSLFGEKGKPSKEVIMERLHRHFDIPLEEFQTFRKQRKQETKRAKKSQTKNHLQLNLNDYNHSETGELIPCPDDLLPLGLPCQVSDHDNHERVRRELNDYFNKEDSSNVDQKSMTEIDFHDESHSEKSQDRISEEDEVITHEVHIAEDIPYDTKQQAKALVKNSLYKKGSYFKIKSSLETGIKEPRSIAVLSLYSRAGSSSIVNNFAIALGQNHVATGVLEAPQPNPHLFQRLGGVENAPAHWECWYTNVKKNRIMHRFNDKEFIVSTIDDHLDWWSHKVHWIPFAPQNRQIDHQGLGLLDSLCIYYMADKLPLLFVDLSHDIEAGFQKLVLEEVDEVWVVLEPDPNILSYQGERIKEIANLTRTKKVYYIINKYYDFHKKEVILNFLRDFDNYIPAEPLSYVPYCKEMVRAEAEQTFAYLNPEGRKQLFSSFIPLFRRVLTDEYLEGLMLKNESKSKRKIFR